MVNNSGYCSLVKATKQILDKVELENKIFAQITSKEHIETHSWDMVALREAIINAIVHNDYTREVPPKVKFFDDRIEIISYGGLPDGLSKEDFFEGVSMPRNKEIMRIFKDLELVEQLGSGVPCILQIYGREHFRFMDNFIRMTFPAAKDLDNVVDNERLILSFIQKDSEISASYISKETGLSSRTVQRYFKSLQDENIIKRIGSPKGGYWKILK